MYISKTFKIIIIHNNEIDSTWSKTESEILFDIYSPRRSFIKLFEERGG